jgi:hypothetical protein
MELGLSPLTPFPKHEHKRFSPEMYTNNGVKYDHEMSAKANMTNFSAKGGGNKQRGRKKGESKKVANFLPTERTCKEVDAA